ncbi:hypothetical protein LTR70_008917 [Exophiala xenobiotica]|uniref:Uncharacterized protein n=1 Tax=Lithohypha guttulata TaxID=1690604 RepID=A0ABR0JZR3_9EURO|nr:hypothetical protein LTR24_008633 [Lithohypha guttulata]KAK5311240.1 hypothetical protein LTR70_008917 [Exophiala xenobiotica]
MNTKQSYVSIAQGEDTLLGNIITMLIDAKNHAKKIASQYSVDSPEWLRWTTLAQAYKLLLVSVYGATGGKHSILSPRVYAEATTYAARKKYSTVSWNDNVETKGMTLEEGLGHDQLLGLVQYQEEGHDSIRKQGSVRANERPATPDDTDDRD